MQLAFFSRQLAALDDLVAESRVGKQFSLRAG